MTDFWISVQNCYDGSATAYAVQNTINDLLSYSLKYKFLEVNE